MNSGLRSHQFVKECAEEVLECGLFTACVAVLVFERLEYGHDLLLLVRGWNWYRESLQESACQRSFRASPAEGDGTETGR